jgi:RNA polymerase sigma-70 factor (ECF subfamily)
MIREDDVEEEAALAVAARDGDPRAFGQLVERFQRPVFNLAYRMLGTAVEAEDAAQEAFVRAHRALGGYDAERPFSTWLLSIAAHHCIDRLRRRRNEAISLDALPPWRQPAAPNESPESVAVRADEADRIQVLLEGLPADYRLVIVLRYWHDFGYAEIAELTEESVPAIKSRLHRARRQLGEALTAEPGPSAPGRRPADRPAAASLPTGGVSACRAMTLLGA